MAAAAVRQNLPPVRNEPVRGRSGIECDKIIKHIVLPILASLAAFLFIPFEGALLLAGAIAVLSVAIYSAEDNAPVQLPQPVNPRPQVFIPQSPHILPHPAPVGLRGFWDSPIPRLGPGNLRNGPASAQLADQPSAHEPVGRQANPQPVPVPIRPVPFPIQLPAHEPVGRQANPQPEPVPIRPAPMPMPLPARQPAHEPVGRRFNPQPAPAQMRPVPWPMPLQAARPAHEGVGVRQRN